MHGVRAPSLRVALGFGIGVLLATAPTAEAAWIATRTLGSASGAIVSLDPAIVRTGSTNAVAAFGDRDGNAGMDRVFVRRTSDSGATWTARFSISGVNEAGDPDATAVGNDVHAVWVEGQSVYYRRSLDGGVAWEPTIQLSPFDVGAFSPSVDADSSGRVAVAWAEWATGKIMSRVSGDSGAGFGPVVQVASTVPVDGVSAVALGTNSIHVVYAADAATIRTKRSLDGGSSWSSYKTLTSNSNGSQVLDVEASGSTVVAAFEVAGGFWTRRSIDNGATWSTIAEVTLNAGLGIGLEVRAGTWHLLYGNWTRRAHKVRYASSRDGTSWFGATLVSTSASPVNAAGNVAVLSNALLAGYGRRLDSGRFRAVVRLGD